MAISHSPTFLSDSKTVSSAGTAVALAASELRVKSLNVVAKDDNQGRVWVGGSDVGTATNSGLYPSASMKITPRNWLNLADVYINAEFAADGVDIYATKA